MAEGRGLHPQTSAFPPVTGPYLEQQSRQWCRAALEETERFVSLGEKCDASTSPPWGLIPCSGHSGQVSALGGASPRPPDGIVGPVSPHPDARVLQEPRLELGSALPERSEPSGNAHRSPRRAPRPGTPTHWSRRTRSSRPQSSGPEGGAPPERAVWPRPARVRPRGPAPPRPQPRPAPRSLRGSPVGLARHPPGAEGLPQGLRDGLQRLPDALGVTPSSPFPCLGLR